MSAVSTHDRLRALGLIVQEDHLRDEPPVCYLAKIDSVGAEVYERRRLFLLSWKGRSDWSGSRRAARSEAAVVRNLAAWEMRS